VEYLKSSGKIESFLRKIFNKAYREKTIPDEWNMPHITSSYKKGDKIMVKMIKIQV
jgi:hypothetical protein